jgi:magnesium chelatase subunit D
MNLNPSLKAEIPNLLMKSLCCVALNRGLRSILLFDISPVDLQQVAGVLISLLKAVTECKIVPIKLGTFESEDDLWGQIGLWGELENQAFKWQSGLLGKTENDQEIRLVIIPDLTKLSLPAMRACVVLMEADVAHLERHGQNLYWQPNLCWLVGCSSQQEEIGKISPHLLDRFAIRLNGKINNNTDRVSQIKQLLNDERLEQKSLFKEREIEPELQQWLKQVSISPPKMTSEALKRILDYTSPSTVYHRRELSLARFSSTFAQLEAEEQVTVAHVDRVAKMIGLKLKQEIGNSNNQNINIIPIPGIDSPENELKSEPSLELKDKLKQNSGYNDPKKEKELPIYKGDKPQSFPDISLPNIEPLENPYIEDIAPLEREMASLKFPTRRFKSKAIARGTIIGVERSSTVQDLAIVRTLLEAAKFQNIRQNNHLNGHLHSHRKLKILPIDIYRHRRAPIAEQMLMVLIDYTCLESCQWEEQLFPYISWAYTQRASIGIMQVGIATDSAILKEEELKFNINAEELRAKKISAQNVLVPSINIALDLEKTKKGQATPLAHGFDLTLQTLRHALQHGRNTIQKAVLVVISDGRGNVPLEASHLGKIQLPVGRKGFEDALEIAQKIGNLDNVDAVFLNPQRKQYPDLPLLLAQALGAKVVAIPPLETWEVAE